MGGKTKNQRQKRWARQREREREGRANYFSLFSIIIFCSIWKNESNQRHWRRSQLWKKWSAEQKWWFYISEKSSSRTLHKKCKTNLDKTLFWIFQLTLLSKEKCVMWLQWLKDTAANMNRKATSRVWGLSHTCVCGWVGLLKKCHSQETHRLISNPHFITW